MAWETAERGLVEPVGAPVSGVDMKGEASELEALFNRTRFRLLAACAGWLAMGLLVLLLIIPSLFALTFHDGLATLPIVVGICAFTGTAQIFLNEHWLQRLLWLAHPREVPLPRVEPIPVLLIRILLVISAFAIPLALATLYTFQVTAFDLFRLGLARLPDIIFGYVVGALILGAGFLTYRRVRSRTPVDAPDVEESGKLQALAEETHSFVLRTTVASLLLWAIAAILAAWGFRFLAGFDLITAIWVMAGIVVMGVIGFPVQYFAFRRIFAPLGAYLLSAGGESYRIESAELIAASIGDEVQWRERLFGVIRLVACGLVWGGFVMVTEILASFFFWLFLIYTVAIIASVAMTYRPRLVSTGAAVRLVADGLALTLLVHATGSMTSLVAAVYFLIVYTIGLHRGFEIALILASVYSLLYGGVLLGEYMGWLAYASAVESGTELLRFLIEKTLWQHFHPSLPFLSCFALISGGMFASAFMARLFNRRQGSLSDLLEFD